MDLQANADRFSGFADLYDTVRPVPPNSLVDVINGYLGNDAALVVDLGSGTGLSTRWAATWSTKVIGVEPSDDMRERAAAISQHQNLRYQGGYSHQSGLPDACADVVLAVQALHWMEPVSTFTEVARLLRPAGVFAAIDCDWPPSVGNVAAEKAWHTARTQVAVHERQLIGGRETQASRAVSSSPQSDELRPVSNDKESAAIIADGVHYWHKGDHLRRMVDSGVFQHCVEVAALTAEHGDADRFVQLFRSQGDYQALRRHGIEDDALGVDAFDREARIALGDGPCTFWFTYRARLGVRSQETAARHPAR
jgi:SAM-dependent methyltransferase